MAQTKSPKRKSAASRTRRNQARRRNRPASKRSSVRLSPKGRRDVKVDGDEFFGIRLEAPSIPDTEVLIRDPKTLEVLYNPIRYRLFKKMYPRPRSVKELADEVGVGANTLYHHVRLLQKHGLVRLADARVVGNKIERLYGLAARRFRFTEDLKSLPVLRSNSMALGDLQEIFDEISQSYLAEENGEFGDKEQLVSSIQQLTGKLTLDQARELNDKVQKMIFEQLGPDKTKPTEDARYYGSYFVFVPMPDAVMRKREGLTTSYTESR
jgi:DNA-binding transcriptional ArsR family regulator